MAGSGFGELVEAVDFVVLDVVRCDLFVPLAVTPRDGIAGGIAFELRLERFRL